MKELPFTRALHDAAADRHGIGAFNVVLLEHAEAIVAASEATGIPVVLQISQNCVAYHGSLAPIVAASQELARRAGSTVLVHLDHFDDLDLVRQGVAMGVDSVMFDASVRPYDQNVRLTRIVADFCHQHGVAVEAELGEVGGKDGVHAAGARTHPGEAAAFVAETGVDALAVAVGTSHAMQSRIASIDHALVTALAEAVDVPLVLHGSSGLPDSELRSAVESGMTKVNISTHLNGLFTRSIRASLDAAPDVVDPRHYVAPARGIVQLEVQRIMTLLRTTTAFSSTSLARRLPRE
jgi:fructose-bisphosphate aldolase, class II